METKHDKQMAAIRANGQRYADLYRAVTERYRVRLVEADDRLPLDMAFPMAHNWGNQEAKAVLARASRVTAYVSRRGTRHFEALIAQAR